MAKKIKMNSPHRKDEHDEDFSFEDVLKELPEDVRKKLEKDGLKSFDDVMSLMFKQGLDPLKMMEYSEQGKIFGEDFNIEDIMLDEEFLDDDDEEYEDEDDADRDDEDSDSGKWYDDESYLMGMRLPKDKFIGKSKREFHIRIKLNDAPVNIWRELVVPSNITLELLAYVLIQAMGWEHEHLYQFIGKGNVYYVNTQQLKEQENSFFGFLSRSEHRNSEKTSLEMALQPKGKRMKFEYDFGDSWNHDLWVKAARDYAADEEPVIKLLKGQGACPPEDCGGIWGYAELLELRLKKRKSADDKERLEWYNISKDFDPEDCDLEWLQDNVEALWENIKAEMQ
jgi:hypothetical protein